ncbi:MAG: hypothetical protein H7Y86_09105, partial [Rhizobacter sp.]|nr:hypothetical protein [Ferruginibacter sp.]
YHTGPANNGSNQLDLLGLMANMLLSPANAAAAKGISASTLSTINTNQIPNIFFPGTNEGTTNTPKAYINYIFLDDQFKYAGGNVSRVGSSGTVKDHWYSDQQLQDIAVPKNGYIFVYVSNESNVDVFFDNLQVIHKPGAMLEETHYYPFGLVQSGISSKAAGTLENKKSKYNGYELNTDFDINLYESLYRTHDPQIGRFLQLDPKPTDMENLYAAMGNNPVKNTDFLGDTTIYYAAGGQELYRTNDEHANGVTFIADDNVGGFNLLTKGLELLGVNTSGSAASSFMRGLGETYNTQSVFDFVDGNSKNYSTATHTLPNDGKGPLINEASAAVEKKDGAWTANPNKTDLNNNNPVAVNKIGNGVNGITLHTHDNEGRKIKVPSKNQTGTVESGPKSVRADNSTLNGGTGIFEMAAGKNAIYFYNINGVVLTLNRDAFTPKKEENK